MQTYDILMTIILVGATLLGAIRGFAWQLASIASIVVSYTVAYRYREPFSQNIHAAPPWNQFLAMFILFVGTSFVIWVALRMVSGMIDRMRLKEFDRQIGALFGLAKGALLCTVITLFAMTLFGERTQQAIVASESGRLIARVLDESDSIMPPELHGVVRPYLDQFSEDESGAANSWFSSHSPNQQPESGWANPSAQTPAEFASGAMQNQTANFIPNGIPNGVPANGFGSSTSPQTFNRFDTATQPSSTPVNSRQSAPSWQQSATPQWAPPRR
ncbi:CvpA family protein [Rhodopirellula sp. JC740]|uniref:CvpA family protein n=1 Tax=Rhodopirellula halodulae TaxID=2894198 RepID=A0ABS8NMN8_9BACT|nr:CvpA family protein [Rhodopirellula sp. JC740]MCC9644053.1 CvpA family protein [Rhodopirellula sp. JC740]